MTRVTGWCGATAVVVALSVVTAWSQAQSAQIGGEHGVARHLQRGEELRLRVTALVEFGQTLFTANWTADDGAGRPRTKGTGQRLSDPTARLEGPRAFNRVSGPEAMSCVACHRHPFSVAGGGGDFVTNVFEGAERFDFATFDPGDVKATRGSVDESRQSATLQTLGNLRSTPSLFGAGYLEMLARQMTADLQRIRDALPAGQSRSLVSTGVSFGVLVRRADSTWDTSQVEGLPPQSLTVARAGRPTLVIRPWQQSGTAISLRELINTSYNQHLGIQTTERFGVNTDPDGDGVVDEMTGGDVTAVAAFIATLQAPGRVIANGAEAERAVRAGERLFEQIGCSGCHISSLPLDRRGWTYSEPGPYNAVGNLRRQPSIRLLDLDLTADTLPPPRLIATGDVIQVPAYTDFKLHDITDATDPTAHEALDLNSPPSSPRFRLGNRRFLTRRLWDVGSRPQFFHDGRFTTIREAVTAHSGEALAQRRAFEELSKSEQDGVLQFLTSMQVLPPGINRRTVDERYRPKRWSAIDVRSSVAWIR